MDIDFTAAKLADCQKHGIQFSENMNCHISFENIILFKKIFSELNINFILYFGTLLGFVREGWFINYDLDTDVCCLNLSNIDIEKITKKAKSYHFDVLRKTPDIISFIRKGEYIDIYNFRTNDTDAKCIDYRVAVTDFCQTKKLRINGVSFDIPINA